jgi:ArsR family transcriptional regulator, arsenate/arsenite/antimonite-responsive transcriptional repressor
MSAARAFVTPDRRRGTCSDVELELTPTDAAAKADLLKALADPTRLQMVLALRHARDPICICDFTATFDLSQPTVSHHMARLRQVGLVEVSRKGGWSYYRLRPELPGWTWPLIKALAGR